MPLDDLRRKRRLKYVAPEPIPDSQSTSLTELGASSPGNFQSVTEDHIVTLKQELAAWNNILENLEVALSNVSIPVPIGPKGETEEVTLETLKSWMDSGVEMADNIIAYETASIEHENFAGLLFGIARDIRDEIVSEIGDHIEGLHVPPLLDLSRKKVSLEKQVRNRIEGIDVSVPPGGKKSQSGILSDINKALKNVPECFVEKLIRYWNLTEPGLSSNVGFNQTGTQIINMVNAYRLATALSKDRSKVNWAKTRRNIGNAFVGRLISRGFNEFNSLLFKASEATANPVSALLHSLGLDAFRDCDYFIQWANKWSGEILKIKSDLIGHIAQEENRIMRRYDGYNKLLDIVDEQVQHKSDREVLDLVDQVLKQLSPEQRAALREVPAYSMKLAHYIVTNKDKISDVQVILDYVRKLVPAYG